MAERIREPFIKVDERVTSSPEQIYDCSSSIGCLVVAPCGPELAKITSPREFIETYTIDGYIPRNADTTLINAYYLSFHANLIIARVEGGKEYVKGVAIGNTSLTREVYYNKEEDKLYRYKYIGSSLSTDSAKESKGLEKIGNNWFASERNSDIPTEDLVDEITRNEIHYCAYSAIGITREYRKSEMDSILSAVRNEENNRLYSLDDKIDNPDLPEEIKNLYTCSNNIPYFDLNSTTITDLITYPEEFPYSDENVQLSYSSTEQYSPKNIYKNYFNNKSFRVPNPNSEIGSRSIVGTYDTYYYFVEDNFKENVEKFQIFFRDDNEKDHIKKNNSGNQFYIESKDQEVYTYPGSSTLLYDGQCVTKEDIEAEGCSNEEIIFYKIFFKDGSKKVSYKENMYSLEDLDWVVNKIVEDTKTEAFKVFLYKAPTGSRYFYLLRKDITDSIKLANQTSSGSNRWNLDYVFRHIRNDGSGYSLNAENNAWVSAFNITKRTNFKAIVYPKHPSNIDYLHFKIEEGDADTGTFPLNIYNSIDATENENYSNASYYSSLEQSLENISKLEDSSFYIVKLDEDLEDVPAGLGVIVPEEEMEFYLGSKITYLKASKPDYLAAMSELTDQSRYDITYFAMCSITKQDLVSSIAYEAAKQHWFCPLDAPEEYVNGQMVKKYFDDLSTGFNSAYNYEDLGENNASSQHIAFAPFFPNTSLCGFKTKLAASTLYYEVVMRNKSKGEEFAPVHSENWGAITTTPLRVFKKEERESLLNANYPINTIGYNERNNLYFFNNNLTFQNEDNVLQEENNRRLINRIYKDAKYILEQFKGEVNTYSLRREVTKTLEDYFNENFMQMKFKPEEYYIQCDDKNNTESVINANKLAIRLYVRLYKSIKYVEVLNDIYPLGVNF